MNDERTGDPVVEALRDDELTCVAYRFDHANKTRLIESLMLATEKAEVTWPAELDTLTQEMEAYEAQRSPSGLTTYNAPAGGHDDCVTALALAWEAKRRYGGDPQALEDVRAAMPF